MVRESWVIDSEVRVGTERGSGERGSGERME